MAPRCGRVARYDDCVRRRLFNLAAVVSVLLCGVTIALWVRSFRIADTLVWSTARGQLREIALMPGEVVFANAAWGGEPSEPLRHQTTYDANDDILWSRRWSIATKWGFGVDEYVEPVYLTYFQGARPAGADAPVKQVKVRRLALRFPLLLSIFSVLPLVAGWRSLRRRRRDGSHCPACGYDLRATPDRCPECGAVPAKAA